MSFAGHITRCPIPFDPDLGRDAAAPFGDHPRDVVDLLTGTAGCSPYLMGLMQRHHDWLNAALDTGPDGAFQQALADVDPSTDVAKALRIAKGRVALIAALADLAGLWSLEDTTRALTEFADSAVDTALRASLRIEHQRGKLPDISRPVGGLVALSMGKMGAWELNYSSDIDLICLFDGEAYGADFQEARASLVRATRKMASTLSENTADGYVFRTDLRLRPDAAVTPVALSTAAAEGYYESVGRTWERAAYIKARVGAGDIETGEAFLARLTPFVWRKHLDYAAIQDAHDMRLRIRAHKGLHGPITLPGHNMKLGRGGIREIEFFTQTRQLISGGRDPDLRVRGTVEGLNVLAQKGWVDSDAAQTLGAAYRAHREVEHRLQMIADAQTHDLPGDTTGFARLAAFMGQDATQLQRQLAERLALVHELTEGFFAPEPAAPMTEAVHAAQDTIDGWYSYPALRSARAVEIFERLKPDLLKRLARAAKPEEAVERFDLFLAGLPAGVQVFSLFEANPQLIDLIVDISVTAPALAQYLGRNAQVFDAVIGGSFFAPWPGQQALAQDLAEQLARLDDYEGQLDATRRLHKDWHFRIGVHFLRKLMSAAEAGQAYADLACAVLKALWEPVVAEFTRKHGAPPGRGAAVLGMGSLGAAQLSATSDLDLIVIYDADGVEGSDGPRPLAARQYYARLTQAFVTSLTAQTSEGALYEVDMRLRPSGRQGPVATSLGAFRDYQRDEAWTWEHLALTRARQVAGDTAVGRDVDSVRLDVLAITRDPSNVLADVRDMRARLGHAVGDSGIGDWESKRGAGRMQELELLGQTGALLTGAPERNTMSQIGAAVAAGLLDEDAAAQLIAAHQWLWRLQSAGRLLSGGAITFEDLGDAGQQFVLDLTETQDLAGLRDLYEQHTSKAAQIVAHALDGGGGSV